MEAHGGYSFCGLAALILLGHDRLCDMSALLVRQHGLRHSSSNSLRPRDHFVYATSQWETMLQCNIISHWLGTCKKWPLKDLISLLTHSDLGKMALHFPNNIFKYIILREKKVFYYIFWFKFHWTLFKGSNFPSQRSWWGAIGMGLSVRSSIRIFIRHTFWFLRLSGQTAEGIYIKPGGYIHYGTPEIWLTLGYAPMSFCCVLASDWWSSFHAFANKMLIRFDSNFMNHLITGLPRPG